MQNEAGVWWQKPALGQRQVDFCEFEASLVFSSDGELQVIKASKVFPSFAEGQESEIDLPTPRGCLVLLHVPYCPRPLALLGVHFYFI